MSLVLVLRLEVSFGKCVVLEMPLVCWTLPWALKMPVRPSALLRSHGLVGKKGRKT